MKNKYRVNFTKNSVVTFLQSFPTIEEAEAFAMEKEEEGYQCWIEQI